MASNGNWITYFGEIVALLLLWALSAAVAYQGGLTRGREQAAASAPPDTVYIEPDTLHIGDVWGLRCYVVREEDGR